MALYGCGGGSGKRSTTFLYVLYSYTTNLDLWSDNGTTRTFTLTAQKDVGLTVTVTSDYSHEVTITVDGKTFNNGNTIAAGTHTVVVTITGYHYGTTKTGSLLITGMSSVMPTFTLVS